VRGSGRVLESSTLKEAQRAPHRVAGGCGLRAEER
jgi:hypothetical protein